MKRRINTVDRCKGRDEMHYKSVVNYNFYRFTSLLKRAFNTAAFELWHVDAAIINYLFVRYCFHQLPQLLILAARISINKQKGKGEHCNKKCFFM